MPGIPALPVAELACGEAPVAANAPDLSLLPLVPFRARWVAFGDCCRSRGVHYIYTRLAWSNVGQLHRALGPFEINIIFKKEKKRLLLKPFNTFTPHAQ